MSRMIDLKGAERRAWTFYFQDGLWDIFLGLMFVGAGLRTLTDNLWFYLLVAAGVLTLILGKRWITLPRLGAITFSPQRKARLAVIRVAALIALIFTAVIFIMVVSGADLSALPIGWFFVFLVPAVFLLMAYMMDFKRLYGYTLLIAAFMVITEIYGDPLAAWAQIIAGLVPLLTGLGLLVRFLRRYPALDEKMLAERGNDGRA